MRAKVSRLNLYEKVLVLQKVRIFFLGLYTYSVYVIFINVHNIHLVYITYSFNDTYLVFRLVLPSVYILKIVLRSRTISLRSLLKELQSIF